MSCSLAVAGPVFSQLIDTHIALKLVAATLLAGYGATITSVTIVSYISHYHVSSVTSHYSAVSSHYYT